MKHKKFTHPYIANHEDVRLHEVLSVPLLKGIMENFHPKNRIQSKHRVEALVRDVAAGAWRFDVGQFIRFDVNGNLIDGQKRIMAHIAYDAPLRVNVQFGLPPDAILYMDGDQHRTLSDNYSLNVNGQPTRQAFKENRLRFSVATWVKHGQRWDVKGTSRSKMLWTEAELLEFLADRGDVVDFVLTDNRNTRRPGALGAMALYAIKDMDEATEFRDSVYGDAKLPIGSPAHTLRKYLMVKSCGGSYPIYDYNNTVRCINAFHAGGLIKQSKMNNSPTDWEF